MQHEDTLSAPEGTGAIKKRRDKGQTSPTRIRSSQRQAQALELRKAGATYQAIADQLGYASAGSARESVKSALDKAIREPAEELREMELERLDQLLLVHWPKAMAGDNVSFNNVMRLQNRIAELAGYDRATKGGDVTNVVMIGGDSDDYIGALQKLRDEAMKSSERSQTTGVIEAKVIEAD